MLLFDEIPQPLTFYDRLDKQDRFRENHERYAFDLLAQSDRLLPFQLRFAAGETLTALAIADLSGNVVANLSIADIESVEVSDYTYYSWQADFAIKTLSGDDLLLECGVKYYVVAVTNFDQYYSEVFRPVFDIDKYLLIEWRSDNNVEPAYYGSGFRFRLIADTFITKGLPQIFIDSEEDGYGQAVDISRKVTVTYDIGLGIIPGYLFEAVAFMAIHPDVRVSTAGGLREGAMVNISVSEEQIDNAPYWDVTVNFEQGRYYYNTNCGNEIKPPVIEQVMIDQGGSKYVYDTFIDASINK